jgi:hypothetical protein
LPEQRELRELRGKAFHREKSRKLRGTAFRLEKAENCKLREKPKTAGDAEGVRDAPDDPGLRIVRFRHKYVSAGLFCSLFEQRNSSNADFRIA